MSSPSVLAVIVVSSASSVSFSSIIVVPAHRFSPAIVCLSCESKHSLGKPNNLRPGMTRSLGMSNLRGSKTSFSRSPAFLFLSQAPSSPKLRFFASTQTNMSNHFVPPYLQMRNSE
ncbi:hypothetical protein KCV07_g428, partial [Aureobasidium melanogenum]